MFIRTSGTKSGLNQKKNTHAEEQHFSKNISLQFAQNSYQIQAILMCQVQVNQCLGPSMGSCCPLAGDTHAMTPTLQPCNAWVRWLQVQSNLGHWIQTCDLIFRVAMHSEKLMADLESSSHRLLYLKASCLVQGRRPVSAMFVLRLIIFLITFPVLFALQEDFWQMVLKRENTNKGYPTKIYYHF